MISSKSLGPSDEVRKNRADLITRASTCVRECDMDFPAARYTGTGMLARGFGAVNAGFGIAGKVTVEIDFRADEIAIRR
jgi:hypothetical protein